MCAACEHCRISVSRKIGTVNEAMTPTELVMTGTFLLSVGSFAAFCGVDRGTRTTFIQDARVIAALVALQLLWRYPWQGTWFHGLEYEDSYVYTVAARQLLSGSLAVSGGGSSLLTTVCMAGSLVDCREWETFSGHYLGLPVAAASLGRLFGYGPHLALVVAYFAAIFEVVVIYLLSHKLRLGGRLGATAAALLFITTPALTVYGVTGSAEPLSSLYVCTATYLWIRLVYDAPDTRIANALRWLALASTISFACVVKRENLLLAPALALATTASISPRALGRSRVFGLASVLLLVVGVALVLDVRANVTSETGEFGRHPFSLELAGMMLPAFVRAFGTPKWYMLTGYLAILGLTVGLARFKRLGYVLVPLLGYITLYSLHVRSYYQLQTGETSPYDVLRYATNVSGLLCLCAGGGAVILMERLRAANRSKFIRWFSIASLVVAMLTTFLITHSWRRDAAQEENWSRVVPAELAISGASQRGLASTAIISSEPLALQIYGPADLKVVDFVLLDGQSLATIAKSLKVQNMLYLAHSTYDDPVDRERYSQQFQVIEVSKRTRIGEVGAATLFLLHVDRRD